MSMRARGCLFMRLYEAILTVSVGSAALFF